MGPGIVENTLDYHTNNIANSTYSNNNNIATSTYSTNNIAPSMLDINSILGDQYFGDSTLDINSVLCDQYFGDSIIPIYNINNVSCKVAINKLERYRFTKLDPLEMLSCSKDIRTRQEI